MSRPGWDTAQRTLEAVVRVAARRLPERDVDSIRSLIGAGELGIAFENLCTQLDEYEVGLDPASLASLGEIGTYLGLDQTLWRRLGRPPD